MRQNNKISQNKAKTIIYRCDCIRKTIESLYENEKPKR